MLELLFLGTGASIPSRDRATSCIAVRGGSDIILMDCGEGSQRQLMISPFSFMKIRAILITHLHGDHVFGLPGLLQTMSLSGRKESLTVYGPKGIRKGLNMMMTATEGETIYPLDVVELEGNERFQVNMLDVECYNTQHGMPSIGFVIRERDRPGKLDRQKALDLGIKDGPDMARLKKGETVNGVSPDQVLGPRIKGVSISYTGDTLKCDSVAEASKDVSVLIHECTYMQSESQLALDHFHTTALQAAETASAASVRCLMLTHISNRYDDHGEVVAEAKTIFDNSIAVDDMDLFQVMTDGVRKVGSNQLQHVRVGDHTDDLTFL